MITIGVHEAGRRRKGKMGDYKVAPKSVVDELAQFIRQADGNNRMGAGTLADKICERFRVDAPAVQGEPLHPSQVRALRRNVKRNCPPEIYALLEQAITTPQPAEQQPDVAVLVEALEAIAEWVARWTSPGHPIENIARQAIAAHRKQLENK